MRGVSTVSLALFLLSIAGPAYAARTIRFPDEAVGSVLLRPVATAHFGYKTFGGVYGEGWQDPPRQQGRSRGKQGVRANKVSGTKINKGS
jgi:hypothetical protein